MQIKDNKKFIDEEINNSIKNKNTKKFRIDLLGSRVYEEKECYLIDSTLLWYNPKNSRASIFLESNSGKTFDESQKIIESAMLRYYEDTPINKKNQKKQIDSLANNGNLEPLVILENGRVIRGNRRLSMSRKILDSNNFSEEQKGRVKNLWVYIYKKDYDISEIEIASIVDKEDDPSMSKSKIKELDTAYNLYNLYIDIQKKVNSNNSLKQEKEAIKKISLNYKLKDNEKENVKAIKKIINKGKVINDYLNINKKIINSDPSNLDKLNKYNNYLNILYTTKDTNNNYDILRSIVHTYINSFILSDKISPEIEKLKTEKVSDAYEEATKISSFKKNVSDSNTILKKTANISKLLSNNLDNMDFKEKKNLSNEIIDLVDYVSKESIKNKKNIRKEDIIKKLKKIEDEFLFLSSNKDKVLKIDNETLDIYLSKFKDYIISLKNNKIK